MGPAIFDRKILLEGPPSVGKTTAALAVITELERRGAPVQGFTTAEIRSSGQRVGFRVDAIDGPGAVLAHVSYSGPPRVGRYGVDLSAFEHIALPCLERVEGGVVIIDELGKMELASPSFRSAIERLFATPGPVVATVHSFRHPATDDLKARPDVRTLRVTPRNRDRIPSEVVELLVGGREP